MWMDAGPAAPEAAVETPPPPPPPAPDEPAPPPTPPAAPAGEIPAAEPRFVAPEPSRPTSETSRRLSGPLAEVAQGDERREEARRFARLLVSEIKLYNERAVLEGREHGNLYERLRDDIDRSRQMYEERIPQDVRSETNYFYEELVQILADGRVEALGL